MHSVNEESCNLLEQSEQECVEHHKNTIKIYIFMMILCFILFPAFEITVGILEKNKDDYFFKWAICDAGIKILSGIPIIISSKYIFMHMEIYGVRCHPCVWIFFMLNIVFTSLWGVGYGIYMFLKMDSPIKIYSGAMVLSNILIIMFILICFSVAKNIKIYM